MRSFHTYIFILVALSTCQTKAAAGGESPKLQQDERTSTSSEPSQIVPANEFQEGNFTTPPHFFVIEDIEGRKTRQPTITPTSSPSALPSDSAMPSRSPSDTPSLSPSLSKQPSYNPSSIPTISFEPSNSMAPSASPSFRPSLAPSSVPTTSQAPSSAPSNIPTSIPSESPSHVPSRQPSRYPTDVPSRLPSMAPSRTPSISPSDMPSSSPSTAPTETPSSAPSLLPSTSPTLTCHDHADYRSPINSLTCEDHRGTPCVQWRLLGLNTTGLGELLENCPETCEIPCGSFAPFEVPISYQLSGIPRILDSDTKKHLEDITLKFSADYVKARAGDAVFDLDRVELISQNSVDAVTRLRRQLREERLLVTCRFDGFRIGLDMESIIDLLVAGIDSSAFEDTLRASGDPFFVNAAISSAAEIDSSTANSSREEDGEASGATTAAIVVSTLVCISACTLGIWALLFRKKSGTKWWLPNSKDVDDIDVDSQPATPMNVGLSRHADSMISFDNSEARTAATSAPGLLRLITSLSLSRSKSSTDPEDSDSPTNGQEEENHPKVLSPMSGESGESSESIFEEHPLSSVIPPMIVIDHIDSKEDEEEEDQPPTRRRDRQLVPSKRAEASTALLAALNGSKLDQSMQSYDGVWYPSDLPVDQVNKEEGDYGDSVSELVRTRSPLGVIVDCDSDDETSVASTPIYSATTSSPIPFRRSRSSSALDSVVDRSMKYETNLPPSNLLLSSPERGGRSLQESEDEWSLPSPAENENGAMDISFGPMNTNFLLNSGSSSQLPPIHPGTPSSNIGRRYAPGSPRSDATKTKSSIWYLSPIAKVIKDNTPKTLKRASIPLIRKKSSTDISLHSEHTLKNDYNSETSPAIEEEKPLRFEFEAPRKGQLGLVIEANKITGPIVHGVKDYSPLFGLIKKGDTIVEIDGRKIVKKSTLTELMRLLAARPGRRASTMRLVIERLKEDMINVSGNESSDNDDRNTSYGSESSPGDFEIPGLGKQRAEF